jgi:hypothetical protein
MYFLFKGVKTLWITVKKSNLERVDYKISSPSSNGIL